jgi:hypothetical protein
MSKPKKVKLTQKIDSLPPYILGLQSASKFTKQEMHMMCFILFTHCSFQVDLFESTIWVNNLGPYFRDLPLSGRLKNGVLDFNSYNQKEYADAKNYILSYLGRSKSKFLII